MKIFIASDIHGSSFFCEKMIEAFKKSGCEKLVLLGDILYHGPRNDLPRDYNPKKVIELLNQNKSKILCIRRNCDTEVDQMVLDFPVLSEYGLLFIDGITFYITHGHNMSEMPFCENSVVLSGHTHIPNFKTENNITFINPGSISIPKENSPHSYIIYENKIFNLYNLENNKIEKIFKI